jgi:hypothetical protein
MSKHTPGPWKAKKWVGTDPYDDPDRPFVEVGNVHWSPKNWKPAAAIKQTANARLIAAAPELLEALENLLKVHEGEGGTQHNAADMARAAIAKAKGEE